jgi:Asp/Glu/hydantoin racemase
LVASPWSPEASLPNHDGVLAAPIVWAALDCPGAWADARDLTENPVVLGRMAAVVSAPIEVGRRYVVIAWNLAEDGRKSFAATALVDDAGKVVGSARQTWISTRRT